MVEHGDIRHNKVLDHKWKVLSFVSLIGRMMYFTVVRVSDLLNLFLVRNLRGLFSCVNLLMYEIKAMRVQRERLPVQPLGYVMSTKVIFR